jgi:hypothetical protein
MDTAKMANPAISDAHKTETQIEDGENAWVLIHRAHEKRARNRALPIDPDELLRELVQSGRLTQKGAHDFAADPDRHGQRLRDLVKEGMLTEAQARAIAYARHDKRETLICRVKLGEIEPNEAEEQARKIGLEPLTRKLDSKEFDPMTMACWTFPMAVSWIAWRSLEAVRRVHPDFLFQSREWSPAKNEFGGYDLIRPKPTPFQICSAEHSANADLSIILPPLRGLAEFEAALSEGKISVKAWRIATSQYVFVDAPEWLNVEVGEVSEDNVSVSRNALFALWPAPQSKVDLVDLSRHETRFGADIAAQNSLTPERFPGRPTVRPAIKEEFARRAKAEIALKTLAAEADYLWKWAREQFPGDPRLPSKATTVQNQIRDDYRVHKAKPTK